MGSVAGLYEAQGEHARALALFEQIHEIRSRTVDQNNPQWRTSCHSENAVPLCCRVCVLFLRVRRREVPPLRRLNHDSVAVWCHTRLADMHLILGDCAKAKPMYEKCIAIQRATLTDGHPDTLKSMSGLASAHKQLADFEKANELYTECLDTSKRKLGHDHPQTVWLMGSLAGLHAARGAFQAALGLYEQVRALPGPGGTHCRAAVSTSIALTPPGLRAGSRDAVENTGG